MCYHFPMRISGGESKGRRIAPPRHGGVRPTSDKVREALFSILGERVKGAVFLELFAGTGAVGIEAISRGAKRAVFVDSSAKSARLIRENLESLSYRERAAVVTKDAIVFLKKTARELGPYDIVFADPPYHTETLHPGPYPRGGKEANACHPGHCEESAFLAPLRSSSCINRGAKECFNSRPGVPEFLEILGIGELSDVFPEGALAAYEHFKKNPVPETAGRLVKKKDYPYGDTTVSLYSFEK